MKSVKISLLSFAILAIACATSQAAQLASAKVIDVVGSAAKFTEGASSPLSEGAFLKQGDSISVAALSQVKLVFSNGSEVTVEENSSLTLAELSQQSFSGGNTYEQLQADPSTSQTRLELNYGKLDFHVKKLRQDSSFEIETPIGTAAIRGTQGTIELFYNAERGEFLLIVKNVVGQVDIVSRYAGQFEFGQGNIGDKGYDHGISDEVSEPIPVNHTIIIRLHENDPYFDELFQLIQNFIPTGPIPVITPGPIDGGAGEDEDFGVIVVSPEGTGN
jgi:hypothetical protein